MTTNLVASIIVSLITNITERVPMESHTVPCPEGRIGCLVIHYGQSTPIPNPTQKWVRTTVKRMRVLSFNCEGDRSIVLGEETVSDNEVELALAKSWNPVVTNPVPVYHWPTNGWITNYIMSPDQTGLWILTNK